MLTEGLERLREAVGGGPHGPDELCEHVLRTLLPEGQPGDDVALLAMQAVPIAGAHLYLELGSDPDELAGVRRTIERWLESADVDERDAYRVTLAANEACMNAIEHGFGPGAGFEVRGELADDAVDIVVHDHGHWREPRGAGDGRGIAMMRSLMDEVEVTPGDAGTTVRLRRRFHREPPS